MNILNKTLRKDGFRCFKKTKGRFFSIAALIALGCFALVGLQVSGPDMRATSRQHYDDLNVADITVLGDYGLDADDCAAIDSVSGADGIEYGYLKDVVIEDTDRSVRIFSRTETISQYVLVSGRMPEEAGEIALASFLEGEYQLGGSITFTEKEDISGDYALKGHTFSIVGFIESGELPSSVNMGQSTAGTGSLAGFAVVPPEAFDSEVYMIARLIFADTRGVDPFSQQYTELVQQHKDELAGLLAGRPAVRLESIQSTFQQRIDDAQAEVDAGRQQLSDALTQLLEGERQLAEAKREYNAGLAEYRRRSAEAEQQLAEAEQQLTAAKKQIDEGEAELSAKRAEYEAAEAELQAARRKLDDGWAEYNEGMAQLDQLKEAKKKLDRAQAAYDALTGVVERLTGKSVDQVEQELPAYRAELEARQTEYQTVRSLYDLKKQRDAAFGTPEYDELNARYQQALRDAGLTEVQAELKYAQLGRMKAEVDARQLAVDMMEQLVQARYELQRQQQAYDEAARQAEGAEERLAAAKIELEAGEREYAAAKTELDDARVQLEAGEKQLAEAKKEYGAGLEQYNAAKAEADTQLPAAKAELDAAARLIARKEQELDDAWFEYNRAFPEAEAELSDAERQIQDAREKLQQLCAPVYTLDSRREIPGAEAYRAYSTITDIVDSLADVFPIFLYFVAALVTLTTMTRFVDEERVNTGTLKALGYSNRDIISKFTLYGLAASTLGAAVGIFAGHTLLPLIVYGAYGPYFTYPRIELHFYSAVSLIALALALLCAVLPAYIVACKALSERPAALLQPKPPAAGSKIFLERVRPLWNRLSFTHKVTARNIFRYKKRMLMTIFGVCGSVTMLFAGFSVQHSISTINDRQFGQILHYDMIVAESDSVTRLQRAEIGDLLEADAASSYLPVHYEELSRVAGRNQDRQSIKLIVPRDAGELRTYISPVERRSGRELTLTGDGCLISERLSTLLGVRSGDSFTVNDAAGNERTLTVSGICEMYTGHFLFMSSEYYEKTFGTDYHSNAYLLTLADSSLENTNRQASRFMALGGVKGVVQNTTMINQIDTIVHALNRIMDVLIIVASLLAAVILYNLTNINVSERIRELSTIKVLGFYDKEVTLYIYRETILLTLLGIFVGYGAGDALFLYIIKVVPPDEVMFSPLPGFTPFWVSIVVVMGLTALLGLMIHRRLKHVDMLGALKSVD